MNSSFNTQPTEAGQKPSRKRLRLFTVIGTMFLLVLVCTVALFSNTFSHMVTKADVATRDAKLWPFASDSIWNTPVGSGAAYVPANFQPVANVTYDPIYFITTSSTDPKVPLYQSGWAGNRCVGTTQVGFDPIYFPQNYLIPDDSKVGYTPNNTSAILQPDGRSLIQIEPLSRCVAGGPAYGWLACGWGHTEDIEGAGLCGAHFGSGLSSIGGAIRKGELTGTAPIQHALSIEVWMRQYADYIASSKTPGYRWPASQADAYAPTAGGYCSLDPCHSHPNPSLEQGSLLAIPPAVTMGSLNLQTDAAKKIFAALQNYGGYLSDDTGWDDFQISTEKGVEQEFQQTYGYPFGTGAFGDDIKKMFQTLQIIDNNTPDNIGGGGATRRAPWAPAFADGTGGPPPGANPTPGATPPSITPIPTATATTPVGATDLALHKKASASSVYSSGYTAGKADDGNNATGWSPKGSDKGAWWEVDLGSAHTLSQIQLITRQDVDQPETRHNFVIWASNNADMSKGHVVLGTQGSDTLPYQSTWTTNVTDTTAYRYVAVLKTDGGYFFVSELKVLGS